MRTCHACHHELDAAALTAGTCPHCGAVLRKLAQRTIDDKHLVRDRPADSEEPSGATYEIVPEESIDLELTDTDQGGPTIELSGASAADLPEPGSDAPVMPIEEGDVDRKSPTIADQSDVTMEFQAMPAEAAEPPKKAARRSTHTQESDRTVDLQMSPAEARHLDSQWKGTFDVGAKQGQTIRQRETVTGFRSSLPVKSRYIREKRKTPEPAPKTLAEVPDYELLDIIGEGGMGVVYAAHQSSIARTVAVKMLKPSAKVREDQRDKFISEAVVTGELDHPNIVPIYDLGSNDEGALFYSMKRVRGTPWDKVIDQKQLDENLSILLRVSDAVAFAHAGGVIHRDLKPENVMLGDYGEVLVMDWGLARVTPEFAHVDTVYQADSLGGTPAYMSPEMAKGPVENINKTSDIYLLGAILYEIIGGQPPHSGRDVMQCLMAASQNKIDPIRYDGELKAIALTAMATRQEDRYQTVKEFQEAVRVYQSHSESLVLTAHANQNLQKARASHDYQLFARALYGFQESMTLWDENQRARNLLKETQFDYAKCALDNGDLDLAASLLDTSHEDHQALATKIEAARKERNARQRRLRMAKMAVAALIVGIIGTVTTGLVLVNAQRNKAIVARKDAEQQRGIAEEKRKEADEQRGIAETNEKEAVKQSGIAEQRRQEADKQRGIAEDKRQEADEQRALAEQAKKAEEYEAYVAQIGLAAAKIDENAYDYALQLLNESQPELRNWEWGRLYHLCNLGVGVYDAAGPIDTVVYSPDGKSFATGDRSGKLTVRDSQSGAVRFEIPHGAFVMSVDYSRDGKRIASGSSDKSIKIIDAANGRVLDTLSGHTDGVLTVRFSPDGEQLLSGSLDKTARLWDLATGDMQQEFKGNSWWVWAAEFSPDASRIVTAGQDGKAIVWERLWISDFGLRIGEGDQSAIRNPKSEINSNQPLYKQLTEFTDHNGTIYSARFSPQGNLVATGGYDKLVMIWNPDEVRPVDIAAQLEGQPEPKPNYLRLAGHEGPVRCVAFSPNGQLVLSGSEDNSLRVWDVAAGAGVKTLRGHGSDVHSCVFSPDGKFVLAGDDQHVRVWDLAGYQEVRVLHATVFAGHEDAVLSARFSRDGKQIVTASRDRTASLWDAASGRPLHRFEEGHEFLVSAAEFFPGGNLLATGAGDNSVRVWNVTEGTQLTTFTPTGRIGTLAVSPDGKWIATGSVGNNVQIWTAPSEPGRPRPRSSDKPIATLTGHEDVVAAVAFTPNGHWLASGDEIGRVRLWKRDNQAGVWTFVRELVGHSGPITAIRFAPDGQRLITSSGDHSCGQWDVASGEELRQLVLKHPEWVTSLDVSGDGALAITTCDDGMARLWRLADAAKLAEVKSTGKPFNAVGFSPDASMAVLTSAEDKRVSLWDLSAAVVATNQQQSLRPLLDFNRMGSEVWSAMFAPDGRRVLTIGGNDAQLWDIDARKPVVRFSPHGAVASAAVSPDGMLVATGSWDHSAKIWDAATGRALRKLDRAHTGYINSVEFSPDGSKLLTASDDGAARLWDVATGKPAGDAFEGHKARLLGATFSPDATRILTVSGDKTGRIWDRASGKSQVELKGHQWAVLCGQFSADGERVITGSQDKSAIIWDAKTGEPKIKLEGHTAAITSVVISPDGTRALTGSQDNTAKLWDATTGKEILSLPGHTQEITSVSFSPDGRNVLTSSRDGTAIIWLASDWREAEPKIASE
ncbi:MAG: protein kinase [Planctomycetes bacterium]|nr:protein kinase [Planctomycetota bacterium]